MGADRVVVYRYDKASGKLTPADPPFEQSSGSGPRHLVFSPDGEFTYVDTELIAEMRSFRWNAATGRLTPLQAVTTDLPGFAGEKSAAEIAISRDDCHLHVSNRGKY